MLWKPGWSWMSKMTIKAIPMHRRGIWSGNSNESDGESRLNLFLFA